ncbi:hypothetical protein [Dokdonella soli]|uniref:Uncharacterized protein n=2 Tax=Dokdonella soli TaxID=529810 RepID=A0ABN1IBB2_9GAMM
MRSRVRFSLFGLLIAAGLALAPSAFARGHWSVGINLGFPGVSLGYASGCHHCGWGGYYGGYAQYYAPAYYAPAYYAPAYYAPAYYAPGYYDYGYAAPVYYSAPAYGAVYYDAPVRTYYSGRYYDRGDRSYRGRDRDRDYGHRASYYDRDGYYRR